MCRVCCHPFVPPCAVAMPLAGDEGVLGDEGCLGMRGAWGACRQPAGLPRARAELEGPGMAAALGFLSLTHLWSMKVDTTTLL